MELERMYGVEMEAPAGKLPGFYAQVVHKIGEQVAVFDRVQQMLIVKTEEEREQLLTILGKHQMAGESLDLWRLPEGFAETPDSDYGFLGLSGNAYLLADLVTFFQFTEPTSSSQEQWAALEQMKEHILLQIPVENANTPLYAVDRNLSDLIEGIARAYTTQVTWIAE
ncbi:MAG TPA: hypothetical protein VE710_06275 [Candidatus Bathyarchaeia archaeon]|nr:hypothetical protein [Candidatus Bathyarchaeia archaeon]